MIRSVRRAGLTYLSEEALDDLYRLAAGLSGPGAIIEAGCALGGSALVLAAAKPSWRSLLVYDVFGMIPSPGEADGSDVHERYRSIVSGSSKGIAGGVYYGYRKDLLGEVTQTFERYGLKPEEHSIRFIKGLYEETFRPEGPIALAHIDCDWYDSVAICLDRLHANMVPGGRIVIDDYDTWSGAQRAVDDFVEAHPTDYGLQRKSRLHLVRTGTP